MSNGFICENNKYELRGPKQDTICLPVTFANLPAKIQTEGYELLLKDEFHISLVCVGKIIEKNNLNISDFLNKVIADFCDFTRANDIELQQYRNEFKFVSENEKKSVVVMCDVLNLNKFFDFLNQKYKLNLEYPPTHVTLYTSELNQGIFLTDANDISRLTTDIQAPVKLHQHN